MSQDKLIPIGGIYTKVSPRFQRGVYEEGVRCLKSSCHDDAVVVEVKGIIDDQGRLNKTVKVSDTVPTLRSESHGNHPKTVLEVKVKEATKQGYSICRGGEIPSTSRCREAKQGGEESG